MRKLIVMSIWLGLAWRLQGQPRGDAISGPGDTSATTKVPASLAVAAISISRTNPVVDGALIGFDKLAGFAINVTDDLLFATNSAKADVQVNGMIPEAIRALDDRDVTVEGFMMPLEFEKDKTVEFLLVQAPFGCCFGTPPQIHELIKVRARSPGVSPIMDGPARVRGILHVGVAREHGYLSSIYRLEASSVTAKPQR